MGEDFRRKNWQDNFFKIFGKFLDDRGNERGARKEFADLVGIDNSYLSMIERKDRDVSESVIRKIEKAFGIPEYSLDDESIESFNSRPPQEKADRISPAVQRIGRIANILSEGNQLKLLLYALKLEEEELGEKS